MCTIDCKFQTLKIDESAAISDWLTCEARKEGVSGAAGSVGLMALHDISEGRTIKTWERDSSLLQHLKFLKLRIAAYLYRDKPTTCLSSIVINLYVPWRLLRSKVALLSRLSFSL